MINIEIFNKIKKYMIDDHIISEVKLNEAQKIAKSKNETLGKILVKMGLITEEKLISFIGEKMNIPYVNIKDYTIDPQILDRIPEKIARRYRIIPLFDIENELTVAMSDPLNIISIDEISAVAGGKVEPVIASDASIHEAIDQWYGVGDIRTEIIEQLAEEFQELDQEEKPHYSGDVAEIRLRRQAEEAPIVRLVNTYIAQAILENASDIHFEPKRDAMEVRFRIDGYLYKRSSIPVKFIAPMASRIKIMSGLDIVKKRLPQDGRISMTIRDRRIDMRTSTLPSIHGENIVLRILDKSKAILTLAGVGFSDEDLATFRNVITSPKGIILATGPTGTGKTTTIYAAVNTLNTEDKNIMTVEDPIEYEIEKIVQSQVDPKVGMSFATALRSILRQDPDVVYIGEIRDTETADIAVRAALTGHLVLSTLHTNDAVGAVMRLHDLGVEMGLIEAVLVCSFAQRLVRRICPRCKQEYQPDEQVLTQFGLAIETKLYKGVGCEFCGNTGYRGRIGIFEIFRLTREIRALITQRASEDTIRDAARSQGMKTLFEDGLQKVQQGMTTLEEIKWVTEATE